VVYSLQRYRSLQPQDGGMSFSFDDGDKPPSADQRFATILRDGAAVGVHLLVWADSPATLDRTLDRQQMRNFDHRVLFQMSATDSSNLIDTPMAGRLGPHRAIYFSDERGVIEKFRPYGLPEGGWLQRAAAALGVS